MKRWIVFGCVALAVAAAGVSYAAIPDSGGVIHACYKQAGHDDGGGGKRELRVIDTDQGDTCKKNEIALDWNQQGPQGNPGPQGEPGPSEAYRRAGATASLSSDALANELIRVELPAGRYAITANGTINKDGPSLTACQLLGTSPTDTGAYSTSAEIEWATISLTGVVDVTEPRAIRVTCLTTDAGVQATAQVLAVKVGALR